MTQLIDVQCPHCGALGQMMIPLPGSVIIGPCPHCENMVVVFCGQVLPLDTDIIKYGSVEEKTDNLLGVLTGFLEDRIPRLLANIDGEGIGFNKKEDRFDEGPPDFEDWEGDESTEEEDYPVPEIDDGPPDQQPQHLDSTTTPIGQEEANTFKDVDLELLDDEAYFKSVFGNL